MVVGKVLVILKHDPERFGRLYLMKSVCVLSNFLQYLARLEVYLDRRRLRVAGHYALVFAEELHEAMVPHVELCPLQR